MSETAASVLTPWSNFYIMCGSSAASLTGLMFVVITLVTNMERLRRSPDGMNAFSTPTVVHFGAALLLSAIVSAPWRSLIGPAILLGVIGACGVVYMVVVMHRTRRLSTYSADLEDWAWYTILPFAAYGAVLTGAILLVGIPANALFLLAGGVVLLIFIGIRNSWDIVTFIATGGPEEPPSST